MLHGCFVPSQFYTDAESFSRVSCVLLELIATAVGSTPNKRGGERYAFLRSLKTRCATDDGGEPWGEKWRYRAAEE